jgi:hypothetical protein
VATRSSARFWLRAEGLAAFVAGLAIFVAGGGPWLLAIPLLLVPDVSMIGYLRDPKLSWGFGSLVLRVRRVDVTQCPHEGCGGWRWWWECGKPDGG